MTKYLFLLIALFPFVTSAQTPSNIEVPSEHYVIENNIITFNDSFCDWYTGGDYFVAYETQPSVGLLGDRVSACSGYLGTSYGLGSTTAQSALGLGDSSGTRFEYRWSTTYLGTPQAILTIKKSGSVYSPFYSFVPNSELTTLNLDYETRFTGVVVSGSSSSTIVVNPAFYLETNEYTVNNRPDAVLVTVTENNLIAGNSQLDSIKKLILPLVTGNGSTTINLEHNYADGSYTGFLNFWNVQNDTFAFSASTLVFNFIVSGGSITSYSTVTNNTGLDLGVSNYQECGVLDITGCIINAGRYLVVPNEESIQNIIELRDDISTRWPFIYAFQMSELITDLYTGESTASSSISYDFAGLGQLELISVHQIEEVPFTAWLRETLGLLMWLMFGMLMYNRVLRIFNQNPQ